MSQLFASGGQSIGVSASASVLPKNTQDWSPLEWTGWISLQSKGLSRVFSNTTVQKHQFFGAKLSLQSNSHIHITIQEMNITVMFNMCPFDYQHQNHWCRFLDFTPAEPRYFNRELKRQHVKYTAHVILVHTKGLKSY